MTRSKLQQPVRMREHQMHFYSLIQSPIHDLMLVADATALIGLYFVNCDHIPIASRQWTLNPDHAVLQQAAKQLEEYFERKRESFSVPIRLAGTDFQERVWREIALIPYGETASYSDLADRAGAPRAIRAAGTSTGRNPVAILIPCHRVVGKNGSLCGFAGGVEKKKYLLALEGAKTQWVRKEHFVTTGGSAETQGHAKAPVSF